MQAFLLLHQMCSLMHLQLSLMRCLNSHLQLWSNRLYSQRLVILLQKLRFQCRVCAHAQIHILQQLTIVRVLPLHLEIPLCPPFHRLRALLVFFLLTSVVAPAHSILWRMILSIGLNQTVISLFLIYFRYLNTSNYWIVLNSEPLETYLKIIVNKFYISKFIYDATSHRSVHLCIKLYLCISLPVFSSLSRLLVVRVSWRRWRKLSSSLPQSCCRRWRTRFPLRRLLGRTYRRARAANCSIRWWLPATTIASCVTTSPSSFMHSRASVRTRCSTTSSSPNASWTSSSRWVIRRSAPFATPEPTAVFFGELHFSIQYTDIIVYVRYMYVVQSLLILLGYTNTVINCSTQTSVCSGWDSLQSA